MPRSAAAIIGLVLVAFSIGFNTVRYPVVWEMVGATPGGAEHQSPATVAKRLPDSSLAQSVAPPSQPQKPIELPPARQPTQAAIAGSQASEPQANNTNSSTPSGAQKPLVPIVPIGSAGGSRNDAAARDGIRRLPPVTQENVALSARDAPPPANGSIPIYPTTGIE